VNRVPEPHGRLVHGLTILFDLPRQAGVFIATVFFLSVAGVQIADKQLLEPPEFVVDIRADTNTVAQLFYDVGRGMNEADSVRLPVTASTQYSTLRFALPSATIRALRFDPIIGPGTIFVRRAHIESSSGFVLRRFASGDLIALHQIANRADTGSELRISTVPSANDPMLQIDVRGSINLSPWSWHRLARILVQLVGCLLVTALAATVYLVVRPRLARTGQILDRLALAASDPEFLVVDRFAIGCYLGVLGIFVLSVAAGLHGSAISLYSTATAVAPAPVQPIIGIGKPIRGDEWAYHTPAILHQVYRVAPFDGETTPLGPDHTSLISNIPVRHFTTLFRPQFWGFFLLPPAYAFAFYWQFKALLLLTGVFSLLLLLTMSSRIAAFGALWYAFSPHIQWTYSWASLLPEMIGLFCIVMCAVFYMSVGRRPAMLVAAAAACAVAAVNFALCAYVPHQIPLVWLGVFLCIWWVSARWKAIFTRDYAIPRIAVLGGAWLVVIVVMVGFYQDAEAALTTMTNTLYPGRRSSPAGTYSMLALFSHFFSFWEDDLRVPLPQIFINICECAGFFWLAPVTLFSMRGVRGDVEKRRAYWILTAFGALLFIWMTLPVPNAIGQALFLDKAGAGRCVHVLGLVNVALVALSLSFCRAQVGAEWRPRQTVLLGATVLAIAYPALLLTNRGLANFLTTRELVTAASYATVLIVAVVQNRFRLLAAFLVLPQIAVFGLVNPVDRGLKVVETAPLFRLVHSRPEFLRQRWIVYSGSPPDSTFFSAVGCDVVNGLKYVPDLKTLSLLDPTGAQRDLVNRSAWLLAEPEYGNRPATFDELPPNILRLKVNPLDPALRHIGVRYAAFLREPPPEIAASMKPLANGRVSGFWLYELP
jgi:hypothetical protein